MKTIYDHTPEHLHGLTDGLSLHYYVHPGGWENKGSATEFDEKVWYETMKRAYYMETLVNRHADIMDQYDPDKKVGMIVDEWGCWFDVEPGTNPGFLYQQSTMRDAVVAGLTLNIFNKHSDRVKMANIAQLINVLQSVILTEGEKMILTPTYHIFNMYKYHQNATLLESHIETETIGTKEFEIPNLSESVSMAADGTIHITIANTSVSQAYPIEGILVDQNVTSVTGEIVTGAMQAHNTFENPEQVTKKEFKDVTVTDAGLKFTIPACSVVHLAIK